jgi:hypothetical protein
MAAITEVRAMALRNPVAVYNAGTNVEAHVVKLILNEAGIEAHVADDVSVVGLWAFGTLPEIHKPQRWRPIKTIRSGGLGLRKRRLRIRGSRSRARIAASQSAFPASDRGKIRQCPHCRGYVDVGEAAPDDTRSEDPDGEYWLADEDSA